MSQGEEALRLSQILLIRIDFFMGDKIRTFCSSTVGVGKIAGSESGAPRAWLFFYFQKNNAF